MSKLTNIQFNRSIASIVEGIITFLACFLLLAIINIPATIISSIFENDSVTIPVMITYSVLALFVPAVYAYISYKRGYFLGYKKFNITIQTTSQKQPKLWQYILRVYLRLILAPILPVTMLIMGIAMALSNGHRDIFDYILGTEAQEIEK